MRPGSRNRCGATCRETASDLDRLNATGVKRVPLTWIPHRAGPVCKAFAAVLPRRQRGDHGMALRRISRMKAALSSSWRRRMLAPNAFLALAAVAPDRGEVRYVTDGDTFRLTSGERIRISGTMPPKPIRIRRNAAPRSSRGRFLLPACGR